MDNGVPDEESGRSRESAGRIHKVAREVGPGPMQ